MANGSYCTSRASVRKEHAWCNRHHHLPGKSNIALPKSRRQYFDHLPSVGVRAGEFSDLLQPVPHDGLDGITENEEIVHGRYRQFPEFWTRGRQERVVWDVQRQSLNAEDSRGSSTMSSCSTRSAWTPPPVGPYSAPTTTSLPSTRPRPQPPSLAAGGVASLSSVPATPLSRGAAASRGTAGPHTRCRLPSDSAAVCKPGGWRCDEGGGSAPPGGELVTSDGGHRPLAAHARCGEAALGDAARVAGCRRQSLCLGSWDVLGGARWKRKATTIADDKFQVHLIEDEKEICQVRVWVCPDAERYHGY
mmetsp:Transcript_162014/g.519445  ORF Transcript_162014/g.519445 Transcript_162014/m.519445 type:complete len:305 (-) Transcript_162014:1242-2156(-)